MSTPPSRGHSGDWNRKVVETGTGRVQLRAIERATNAQQAEDRAR